jgi:ribosomal protein S18 acetylase RimI-like enzyme
MSLRATPSEWSTEVFGFKVGTLDVPELPQVQDVRSENKGFFDVVFVKCPGWQDPVGVVALDYLYDMEQTVLAAEKKHEVLKAYTFSETRLEIAETAFSDSRFLRDPKLKLKASKMYIRWVSENPHYVLRNTPNIGFLVDSMDPDGANRISLLAVSKEIRRVGIGKRLTSAVFAGKPGVWRVRVTSRSFNAIRFYETIGFRMKSVTTAFHVWMDKA